MHLRGHRVEPAADLVAAVHDRTEGNPFVAEVFRLLAAEGRLEDDERLQAGAIPEGIRQVIGRRLNRLSDAINEILTVASSRAVISISTCSPSRGRAGRRGAGIA